MNRINTFDISSKHQQSHKLQPNPTIQYMYYIK